MSTEPTRSPLARLDELVGPTDASDPKARRRLHVLRVATELFVRQGYRKTSMDEVAQQAGVAKGTLYAYFANKIDLLVAAVALEKREGMGAAAEVLDPSRPAAERLRALVMGMLLLPARMPLTAALMRGDQEMAAVVAELPAELRDEGARGRSEFVAGLVDEVARPHGWTAGELHDRADVLCGLAYLSTMLHAEHVRGDVTMERYAEILADTLVAGLRSAARPSEPRGASGSRQRP
jgi:AcrR family transcriptional regulator